MAADRIGPVVVGVDGSPNSRRALVRAGTYAQDIRAGLVVVHACGLTEEIDGERIPSFGHRDEIAEQMTGIRAWGGRFVVPIPEVEVF